jgi:hypothetical protein
MLKNLFTALAVVLFGVGNAQADPGLSSLEGLWVLYLILGAIIFLLILTGIFWGKITWNYVVKREARFRWFKTYIFLTIIIVTISGVSAFTFHPNAPYSQNIYFVVVSLFAIVVSVLAILSQYMRLKVDNDNT